MAVSDTDFNILELPQGNGGGGGGDIELTSSDKSITIEETSEGYDLKAELYSSTNTVSIDKTEEGVDINVNGEDTLRIYVKNFNEFMDAVLVVGNKYAAGDTTNCVIQLLDNIDMTAPSSDDEDYYKIGGNKLIDRTNKTYLFAKYLSRTSIISDGTRKSLLTIFYQNSYIDTWSIKVEKTKFENINLGGVFTLYKQIHGGNQKDVPIKFSRFLLQSSGNCDIRIFDCMITCCGANQDDGSRNPLMRIGSASNTPEFYHCRIELHNCDFYHGTDMTTGTHFWAHCNAPIEIENYYHQNYNFYFTALGLTKSVNLTAKETGVPNFRILSKNASGTLYSETWEVVSDGTSLISHYSGGSCIPQVRRLATNDIYIQGDEDMQPSGATNTYNWISLVDELKARQKTENKLSQTEIDGIVSSGVGAQENKYLDGIGLGAVVRGLTSCHYLFFWGNPTSGFTISQSEFSDCVTKILRGDKVIPLLLLLDTSFNSLCTFIPANMYSDSQTTIKFVYISYYPTMIGRFEVTASLVGSTSTIQFIQ